MRTVSTLGDDPGTRLVLADLVHAGVGVQAAYTAQPK